ncbi:MAG: 2-hydroxyacid dehydrogenase [Bryobacteraceae bacterium]
MHKLVIWDRTWAGYADKFAARLGPEWRIAAGSDDPDWLLREIEDATALLTLRMPAEALPRAANLRVILYPGAGLLQSDPQSVPAGCPVVNVYEHEAPVAEFTIMAMLLHATRLRTYVETFAAGKWDGSGRLGGEPHLELAGKTLGVLGYGRIGRALATRARAFEMRVAAISRSGCSDVLLDFGGGPSELEALLKQSDFFVIAAPLTTETQGLIGARQLELLPPNAYLVNVSRAEIVDEQALYDALASCRLGGAALDVWYHYPDPGQPGHGSRLPFHTLSNVLCTPHYSAWTLQMILRRIDKIADNLHRLARGEALERVVLRGIWRPRTA